MVEKIITRGAGKKTTQTMKNKEKTHQSIQSDTLAPYIVYSIYLSNWEQPQVQGQEVEQVRNKNHQKYDPWDSPVPRVCTKCMKVTKWRRVS